MCSPDADLAVRLFTRKVTWPASVNFTALPSKLISTWRSFTSSPRTGRGFSHKERREHKERSEELTADDTDGSGSEADAALPPSVESA